MSGYEIQRHEGVDVGWETIPRTTAGKDPMTFADKTDAVAKAVHIVSLSSNIYQFRVLCPDGEAIELHKNESGPLVTLKGSVKAIAGVEQYEVASTD